MHRWLLYVLLLTLGGCQSNSLLRDYDPGRDYSAYRSWQWHDTPLTYRPDDPRLRSDLTERRIRDAIAGQLEQRGLRQAPSADQADLRVQVSLMLDTRQQELRSVSGGYWGNPWYGPVFQEVRTIDYQVRTLQIDLFDGKDGRLIWRAAREDAPDSGAEHPSRRSAAIQRSVAQMLQYFPPH